MTVSDDAVDSLRAISDPAERGRRATELIDDLTEVIGAASSVRQAAIEEMRQRMSPAEIAAAVGLTRARVSQLLRTAQHERALLAPDAGPLTVVLGQKKEADRGDPVIALETATAYDRLVEFAKNYQLEAHKEAVKPGGFFDLNRGNLVVLAGPRLFPFVGQMLAGDPNLRFDVDDSGMWLLRDLQTGKEYRSPRDIDGAPRDYGYLGRLPRPDGAGTFLCASGLHATGTQGVIAYLETALADLYGEVKKSQFSVIVECEYDPESLHVTTARRASPIYKRS